MKHRSVLVLCLVATALGLLTACFRAPSPEVIEQEESLFTDADLLNAGNGRGDFSVVEPGETKSLEDATELDLELPEESDVEISTQGIQAGAAGFITFLQTGKNNAGKDAVSIWLSDQSTGERVRVYYTVAGDVTSAAVSVDGNSVYFTGRPAGETQHDVYHLDIAADTATNETSDAGYDDSVTVSADGNVVVWEHRALAEGETDPKTSVARAEVRFKDSSTNATTSIRTKYHNITPSVSADGGYIAFALPNGAGVANYSAEYLNKNNVIRFYEIATKEQTGVRASTRPLFDPSISNGASKVAWMEVAEDGIERLRIRDIASNKITVGARSNGSIDLLRGSVASDGNYIVVQEYVGSNKRSRIRTRDLELGTYEVVAAADTAKEMFHEMPFWQLVAPETYTDYGVDHSVVAARKQEAYSELSAEGKALADQGRLIFNGYSYSRPPTLLDQPASNGLSTLAGVGKFSCPVGIGSATKKTDDFGTFFLLATRPGVAGLEMDSASGSFVLPPETQIVNPGGSKEHAYVMLTGWGSDGVKGNAFDTGLGQDEHGWFMLTLRGESETNEAEKVRYTTRVHRLRNLDANGNAIPANVNTAPYEVDFKVEIDKENHIKFTVTPKGNTAWVNPFDTVVDEETVVRGPLTLGGAEENEPNEGNFDEPFDPLTDKVYDFPAQTVPGMNKNGIDNRFSLQINYAIDGESPAKGSYVPGIEVYNLKAGGRPWNANNSADENYGYKLVCPVGKQDIAYNVGTGDTSTEDRNSAFKIDIDIKEENIQGCLDDNRVLRECDEPTNNEPTGTIEIDPTTLMSMVSTYSECGGGLGGRQWLSLTSRVINKNSGEVVFEREHTGCNDAIQTYDLPAKDESGETISYLAQVDTAPASGQGIGTASATSDVLGRFERTFTLSEGEAETWSPSCSAPSDDAEYPAQRFCAEPLEDIRYINEPGFLGQPKGVNKLNDLGQVTGPNAIWQAGVIFSFDELPELSSYSNLEVIDLNGSGQLLLGSSILNSECIILTPSTNSGNRYEVAECIDPRPNPDEDIFYPQHLGGDGSVHGVVISEVKWGIEGSETNDSRLVYRQGPNGNVTYQPREFVDYVKHSSYVHALSPDGKTAIAFMSECKVKDSNGCEQTDFSNGTYAIQESARTRLTKSSPDSFTFIWKISDINNAGTFISCYIEENRSFGNEETTCFREGSRSEILHSYPGGGFLFDDLIAINERDSVIGDIDFASYYWTSTQAEGQGSKLSDITDGNWEISGVKDINNNEWILGYGRQFSDAGALLQEGTVLLTPIIGSPPITE